MLFVKWMFREHGKEGQVKFFEGQTHFLVRSSPASCLISWQAHALHTVQGRQRKRAQILDIAILSIASHCV